MTAPKPLPRCCEMDDAIDRAERCTAGHGGALCDRCFSNVVNASPSPARDEVREAAEGALGVLTDLAESAAYWSEYDVPLGIVSRVDFAKARLAAALAAKGGA